MEASPTNQWLQEVFRQLPDGIAVMALDGTLLDANPAFLRMLGRDLEAGRGRQIQELIPADQRAKWRHDIDQLITANWTIAESQLLGNDDRPTPILISLIARVTHENQAAVILHVHDLSIFHTVEQALQASEDQWARSFDAITDAMCILDRAGGVLRANQAMRDRFLSDADELIGKNYRELFGGLALPGTDPAGDLIAQAPWLIEETTFPKLRGWFSVSLYPLKNDANTLSDAILIAKDITASRALHESLKKHESALRQAAKMEAVGRLASGIAHDFNNLLTSILGFCALILRSFKDDDPRRQDLQEVICAGERAASLTRQLLFFSHEQTLEMRVLQLNAVIENLASFLRRTLGEDITLHMSLAKDLWNIRADISRLEQILLNLALNARDAMSKGGQLSIDTSNQNLDARFCQLHPGLNPGNYVLLEVSDTGRGMPPEVLERMFEPFFTTKEKGKGFGLGLATIYGIVRQFGGYIACDSELNQGTTFKIYLPQCLAELTDTAVVIGEPAMPRGQETVLVVDDDPNIVATVGQLLKDLGYQVLTATSSSQALTLGATHPGRIDLALADVIMPGLYGTDLVQVLMKKRPDLKALYMSGYAGGNILLAKGINQAATYLQKPFSLQTLASHVRQALDKSS